jgi:hypothetical protein
MVRKRPLNRDDAEQIAIRALSFLVSDPERLARFLDLTGLRPDTLRAAAKEPHFLSRVLDHVAEQETLLVEVAADQDLPPERVAEAHALLGRSALGADVGG